MVAIKNTSRYSSLETKEEKYQRNTLLEKLNEVDSKISEISNSSLPSGVSGFYSPSADEGAVGRDLPEPYKTFVRQHEIGHALGLRDEYQTDLYAAARTGHPEFIRGPFYKPPLRNN